MKKIFIVPEIRAVHFSANDIITTSEIGLGDDLTSGSFEAGVQHRRNIWGEVESETSGTTRLF